MEEPPRSATQENSEALPSPPKLFIPPPLNLLPRSRNVANSLLPLLPLPQFIGTIPEHEPYAELTSRKDSEVVGERKWIGEAFQEGIVYQKYPDHSYQQMDIGMWNVWVCDVGKLQGEKPDNKGSSAELLPFYTVADEQDKTLVFESRFESGNLSLAAKVSPTQYNLLLQNDINTTGYTQWFFFRVSNTTKNLEVKFNILNLYKSNSLFGSGMRVVVYSAKEQKETGRGWHRDGSALSYQRNSYSRNMGSGSPCYTFSWTYQFQYDQDQVYFAYSYPYTYSDLDQFLEQTTAANKRLVRRTLLTKTLVGNRVDLLTITEEHPDPTFVKGFIVIGARVHPGETVSSYIAKGLITFLTSDSPLARRLRQTFIFKIVPMINPDGVIHGNYRTNISGADLNRKWADCTSWHHQEIYNMRKMILKCEEESTVHLFCDLHGHSIKKSAFVYGNHNNNRPFQGKQFPYILGKLCKSFLFKNCSFLSKEVREGSGRSALAGQLNSPNVYTLESSFCGPENQAVHFTVKHLEDIGKRFCQALQMYFQPYIRDHLIEAVRKGKANMDPDLQKTIASQRHSICQELYKNKLCLVERVNSENSQGSEQQVDEENIITEEAVRKFLQKSSSRSCSPTRQRHSLTGDITKSAAQFVIHKSPQKKRMKSEKKAFKKQSAPSEVALTQTDRMVLNERVLTSFKPKRDSTKNLVTPGKLNLEFVTKTEKTPAPHQLRPVNVDKSRLQSYSQARYEFLMGLDQLPANNCLNNFITSFPRKSTARRQSIPEMESPTKRSPDSSKLIRISEVAKKVYQQKLESCMERLSPKKRLQKEPECDYNLFRNVLESLKKR